MMVPGEMELAKDWRNPPCSNIPRRGLGRMESARSFPRLLRCLADTRLSENSLPDYPLVLHCEYTVVFFDVIFPVSISKVAPMSGRMGE